MSATIIPGDALEQLRLMPDESVNCIVTSPPYWGLRDYGVDRQIGLESTLQDFIARLVTVFAEARRVLRSDGVAWVNMGDSYWRTGGPSRQGDTGQMANRSVAKARGVHVCHVSHRKEDGACRPKNLIGQPWRLAFALQDDGWYLRQDIIWSKPNPMPESITDRCTKAHEYLFMLTKSERYWSNFDAIKERASSNTHARTKMPDGWDSGEGAHGSYHRQGREKGAIRLPGNKTHKGVTAYEAGDERQRTKAGLVAYADKVRKMAAAGSGTKNNESFDEAMAVMPEYRNKRSVWEVGSEAYSEAHFATFPRALIRPCIIATCPQHGTVLDPFNGSGTTGQVALELGRKYIGIELNPEYIVLTEQRLKRMTLGLQLEAI